MSSDGFPVGKEESNYSLETAFTLGKYGDPELNDPRSVIIFLSPISNAPFYEKHLKDLWEEKFEDIRTNLHVTVGQDNLIYLSSQINHWKAQPRYLTKLQVHLWPKIKIGSKKKEIHSRIY